ncbi:MAG: hypothetical protein AAF481_14155 [Acidobacteriota bacterium]
MCAVTALLAFGFAALERTPEGILETIWLGTTAVLGLVLGAALGGRWLAPGAVTLGTVLIALPPGPSRSTAVLALALALVIAEGIHALQQQHQSWIERFAVLAPLALAAQLVWRGATLFEDGVATGSWLLPAVRLLAPPVAAAAALAFLTDARRAATVAALVVLFGPGWNLTTTVLVAPAAWVASRLPAAVERWARGGVLVLFFFAAAAAAYPWLAAHPSSAAFNARPALTVMLLVAGSAAARPMRRGWIRVLGATVAALAALACLPPAPGVVPLPVDASLTVERPQIRLAVPEGDSTRLLLSTSLSNSVELPAGTEVARLQWLSPAAGGDGDRVIFQASLLAGRDTAEWAARRPDVRAALEGAADDTPTAFHWLSAHNDGPFFGTVYRAEVKAPDPLPGGEDAALRWIRSPNLPPEVLVRIHRLEVAP